MTNANGFNETIFVGLETTFKNPPGSPAGYKLPVMNPSLKPSVTRFRSEALTGSAQPRKPVDGKVSLAVSFDLECNVSSLAPVLSGVMGSESVQGVSGSYDHVITLGSPESWYVEQQFADISQYLVGKGCRYDKQSFTFDPEGLMKSTVSMRGAVTSISGSAFTVTPSDKTTEPPLSYLFSAIKYDGSAVTDLQEVKLDIDRQAEDVKTMDGSNELADIITKIAMIKGSLKALFQDASIINDALNSTETSLDLYVPSSTLGYGLWVTIPTLLLEPSGPTTNGPGGLVTQEFNFDAYGATAGSKLKGFIGFKAFTTHTVVLATDDDFDITIDGTHNITGTFSAGATTPAQALTQIQAFSGFSAVATGFVRNGRVYIETKLAGSGGSVKVNSANSSTWLQSDTNTHAGADQQAIRFVVTNGDSAVYDA